MFETLAALAEPNRFRIVDLLSAGRKPVGEICAQLKLRQPQVSKHLQVLKAAGWVDVEPVAQQRLYALRPEPFRQLQGWLEHYRGLWDERFEALDEVLAELKQSERKGKKRNERRTT